LKRIRCPITLEAIKERLLRRGLVLKSDRAHDWEGELLREIPGGGSRRFMPAPPGAPEGLRNRDCDIEVQGLQLAPKVFVHSKQNRFQMMAPVFFPVFQQRMGRLKRIENRGEGLDRGSARRQKPDIATNRPKARLADAPPFRV